MRIEFYGKTPAELSSVALLALSGQSHLHLPLTGFNLPNKLANDPLLTHANHVSQSVMGVILGATATATATGSSRRPSNDVDLCVHYSLKYNAAKRPEDALVLFESFLADAAGLSRDVSTGTDAASAEADVSTALPLRKVLLVSGGPGGGGKQKKKFNTVTCLQALKEKDYRIPPTIELGVAYNPYWPAPEHKEEEHIRLQQKVQTDYVSHIWINFGCDVVALEAAVKRIKSEVESEGRNIRLIGSLMVPSKALLAKFRFRPWSGMFLSEEYLSGVEGALTVTKEIMRIYEENDVEILIESPIRTSKDLALLQDLLSSSSSSEKSDMDAADANDERDEVQPKRQKALTESLEHP